MKFYLKNPSLQDVFMRDWESIFKKQGKVFLNAQENIENVIELLKKGNVKTVLDLGCGSGRHTVLLAKNGFDVHAMDISKEGLKLTSRWLKENHLKANLREGSCYERFPYKNNLFDAVISIQVIHHNYHDKIKLGKGLILPTSNSLYVTIIVSKMS